MAVWQIFLGGDSGPVRSHDKLIDVMVRGFRDAMRLEDAMTHELLLALMAGSALAIASCSNKPAETAAAQDKAAVNVAAPANPSDPIDSAMSAAPAAIARDAAVMIIDDDGAMKELRKGSNGFTCMPDSPATPGPDPMCMDANAMKWAAAWIGHKPPPAETVGLIYMLAGGTDASNVDPYGKTPRGGADWVKTGPHVMVVGSESLNKVYPGGEKPDTAKPYVMWAGTPYAHVMIPIG